MKKANLQQLVVAMLISIGGLSVAPATAATQCPSFTVVSYGDGAYRQSHLRAFIKPFQTSTGVRVSSQPWDADYGQLSSMVTSGVVSWNVVDTTAAHLQRGTREQLFEKLPLNFDRSGFDQRAITSYGVPNVYWGTVLAYRHDRYSHPPASWKDFFDLQRFPGPRALYDDPRANIEFALLADGVPKERLYPLTPAKIDQAFRKLDAIKSSVRVWWTDGSTPVQLLLNNIVVMSPAWNGRIFASPLARERLGYTWNGAALELDYWVVPRGAHCVDLAAQFIAFASAPERMAAQARLIGYGPANASALKFLSPDIQKQLPTYPANFAQAFVVDASNWREIEVAVRARWNRWKNR